WTKKFQRGGPDALLPVKKGRPAKMPKKTEKAERNKQIGTLTDCDIRADHSEFQLKQLFKALNLNRKTYYDNLKRIAKKDKYAEV
ncbi:hypothetical protein LOC00_10585, partial [Lactobacillus delbrueckii subsp. lactis]|nr:hypothetical protein [Lactobacillus delbrueckii subsp. lactis]